MAGGKSSRMGRNKALIEIIGKPLITYVRDTLQEICEDIAIISNEPENYNFLSLPIHRDAIESVGPLAGIYTALLHSQQEHCIIVACDMPFIAMDLLSQMVKCIEKDKIIALRSKQGLEPLFAIYPKSALPAIKLLIEAKTYRAGLLLEKLPVVEVVTSKNLSRSLFNINTPEDLEIAKNYDRHS
ncbi:MAG: molybdenum cofactor guanylyltransferase [Deferribacteres bacterium]|nr:molybdenum cofactor guanylyltransferase [candidate division KSB1 bacterium]MCB9503013.1 molybdenum cofactor guanylyltransferase [Deferribacteres bacterium]